MTTFSDALAYGGPQTINGDFTVFSVGFNPKPDVGENAPNPITGTFTVQHSLTVEGYGSTALALRATDGSADPWNRLNVLKSDALRQSTE